MNEHERAFRILGLDSSATREEMEGAYRELKEVWRPDRFTDSAELRRKAEEKQAAVENAYRILQDHYSRKKTPIGDREGSTPEPGNGRGPSILDDTLSERMGKSKGRFPIWIVLFGLVAIAVVISFFTWSPVDVESEPEPSETEKIIADIRAAEKDDKERTEESGLSVESPEAGRREPSEEVLSPSKPAHTPSATQVKEPKKLPPPPPSEPESSLTAAPVTREETPSPTESAAEAVNDATDQVAVEEEPVVSELAQRSFQMLRAKSEFANQLAEGTTERFIFKEWKAVERSASEVYVDLVAEATSDNREVHFVWAVDVEAQLIKPMSQAARDLQSEER